MGLSLVLIVIRSTEGVYTPAVEKLFLRISGNEPRFKEKSRRVKKKRNRAYQGSAQAAG
jgi:hypothetical protein